MNASIASRTLRTLAAWVAVGLFFFPIYYWTSVAFKYGNDIFSRPPNLFHFTPTFDNFQKVFGISLGAGGVTVTPGGGNFFMAPRLWDSIVVATLSTLVAIVIATLASYALSRMQFRGRHHFVNWVLSTRMMPPVAVAVPMFFIYKGFGLLDTFTGMVLIHALMNLPLAVLCFIFSWTEFLFALTLTTTGLKTVPVVSSTFVTSIGTAWGNMAALGAASIVPAFIFILLVQKHLVRGLTMGSLKQ